MSGKPFALPIIVMGSGDAAYHAIQTLHQKGIGKESIIWLRDKAQSLGGNHLAAHLLQVGLNDLRIFRSLEARRDRAELIQAARKELKAKQIKAIRDNIRLAKEQAHHKYQSLVELASEYSYQNVKIIKDGLLTVDGAEVAFDKLIIAESRRAQIPAVYVDHYKRETFLTYQKAIQLLLSDQPLPKQIVIFGEDQQAIQWAQLFRRLGAKVILIIHGHQFTHMSRENSDGLEEMLLNEGIVLVKNASVQSVRYDSGRACYCCEGVGDVIRQERGSKKSLLGIHLDEKIRSIEYVMLSTTDQSMLRSYFLMPSDFKIVEGREGDRAVVDKMLRLSQSRRIFLSGSLISQVGDRRVSRQEATVLSRQTAKIAALNALARDDRSLFELILPDALPLSNYADPEYAYAGYTEERALQEFKDVEVYRLEYTEKNVPIASVNTSSAWPIYRNCFIKIITHKKEDKRYRIIGIEMSAPDAGYAVQNVVAYINDHRVTALDLYKEIKICPTVNESIRKCIAMCPEVERYLHIHSEDSSAEVDEDSQPAIVIGGGLSGYSAALSLARQGKNVVLIEQGERLGGASVDTFASKSVLFNARRAKAARQGLTQMTSSKRELPKQEIVIDEQQSLWQMTKKHIAALIDREDNQLRAEIAAYPNIRIMKGTAVILDPKHVRVTGKSGVVKEVIECTHIIVSTGGAPFIPPPYQKIQDHPNCWDSTKAIREEELPKSVIIVGGGVIGCEFAFAWSRMGVFVTIVSRENLLGYAEPEASRVIEEILVREGVRVITYAQDAGVSMNVVEGEQLSDHFRLQGHGELALYHSDQDLFDYDEKGELKRREISMDETATHVFIACGRRSNSRTLFSTEYSWPAALLTGNGSQIAVNEYLTCCESTIYSAGCCSTSSAFLDLVPTASEAGEVAAYNMLHETHKKTPDAWPTPSAVFLDPPYASVGKTEKDFDDKTFIETHLLKITADIMPIVNIDSRGDYRGCFLKLITQDNILVGATMVGPNAPGAIQMATYFIRQRKTILELYEAAYLRFTMAEAFHYCAEQFSQVQEKYGLNTVLQREEKLQSGVLQGAPMLFQLAKQDHSTSQSESLSDTKNKP